MAQQINGEMAAIVEALRPSVLRIVDANGSVGAGTVWHSDGLILTNAHVVEGREAYAELPDGAIVPTQRLAFDRENDLAALAVDADNLPTIALGDSHNLKPGQWILAMGHPWGMRHAVSAGVVIGAGAALPEMRPGREWLALDLKLRPGHSGGPLVDVAGRLVGINTMIGGPSVGFAIPIHVVKTFLKAKLGAHVTAAVAPPTI